MEKYPNFILSSMNVEESNNEQQDIIEEQYKDINNVKERKWNCVIWVNK